jgi:hypothetical protein
MRYAANHFVSKRKIKETPDSIYYSLKHFDRSLVAERYQKDGDYCGNRKRKGVKEIKKQFPYSELQAIKVVSFKPAKTDSVFVEREIPKSNGKIDLRKMFEVKTLDPELTGKMLDILINYNNGNGVMEVMMCYEPRNGIVFVGKSDNILGYIEICFDCQQYKIEPRTMVIGDFCSEKMDAIQGIMQKAGIKYGMQRTVN